MGNSKQNNAKGGLVGITGSDRGSILIVPCMEAVVQCILVF